MSGSNPDLNPKTVAAVRQLRASLDNQLRHARCAMIETRSVVGEADPAYATQAQFVSEIEERIAVIDRQVPGARPTQPVMIAMNWDSVLEAQTRHPLSKTPKKPPVMYGGGPAVSDRTSVDDAIDRAAGWLQIAELILPPRIAGEEIGDLLEVIHNYRHEGRPAWHIYVRAITGILFAFWHSFSEKIAELKWRGGG
jgi:hypothetical protein